MTIDDEEQGAWHLVLGVIDEIKDLFTRPTYNSI